MKILRILEEKKKKKEIKYIDIAVALNITKQCFYWHLKNLKKGRISFSVEQIKKICQFLNEDISNFFE
ncbi:hypothetical protein IX317_001654 [Fusobacterium sp. DD29]|uniref:XRE family transcriptional regulator n=1 Tax=unclassified Fusobacterium TaxID=2648384 RepID=UPI001D446293|nr:MULTISPECIES: XRE family transcriptional regulator [unclassified Fusobacterium]MBR8701675.1 hypothetical protein [Fusobacterium sp. DD45]MBR8711456.1 hypothetical protein [Fusobacterium sp. DD28]MBR8749974.1 hypothetical protein [Fusobacterium sp. DD29]MBR8752005.1 hypothetical protein [Fusobacterium sp. DD26]MBR8762213.1 hypothetical protein [Fusobacterium sp. DD25]